METRNLVIGMLVVIIFAVFALLIAAHWSYQNSYTSSYTWQLRMDSTGRCTNLTLIVPLPQVEGSSPVADAIFRVEISGLPPDAEAAVLTADENLMLRIRFEDLSMDAGNVPLWIDVHANPGRQVDTMDPAGIDPLLAPRFNESHVECRIPTRTGTRTVCTTYKGIIYTRYDALPGTVLQVSVETEGRNAWWVGRWSGNSYRDSLFTEVKDGKTGWLEADGNLVAGVGRYTWI